MPALIVKQHYSAAELASYALSSVPTTRAALRVKAERERWPFVEVAGQGGIRREYTPPPSVLKEISDKAMKSVVAAVEPRRIKVGPENQIPLIATESQALVADARKGVLLALQTLMNRSGYAMKKAARVMLEMAQSGEANPQLVAMLKAARDGRGRQSPDGLPSVRSLIRFVEYDRSSALTPRHRGRDMSVPDWAPTFLGYYQKPEKPTVEHAYRMFATEWAASQAGGMPSIWQVRRFLDKVGKVTLEMGRMGSHEIKSIKPFIRRTFDTLLPSDVYTADGHRFDAEVQHPLHGQPFRPEITSVLDVATRRAVGWSVGLAESAFAVLDALRDAVVNGGIPAILYVDNGSGYKNELMTDAGTGLMARLGTEMINSLPYNSQARGIIERSHKTIWVNAAKQLPGYIGHDMDRQAKLNTFKLSRKAIKAQKAGETVAMPLIGWPGFVEFCKLKVDEYNNSPHRSLAKITDPTTGRRRHMSPNEAWELAVAKGFEPHTVPDDELRPLFRPQVLRTVHRGEIEVFGNRYASKYLEEFHTDQMRIGYDIHDPEKVWVYDPDGRFVCTAELNGNSRSYIAPSVTDRARDKRLDAKIKRLDVKHDTALRERHGAPALENMESVHIPGFINMTRDELARSRQAPLVDVTEVNFTDVEVVAAQPIVPDAPEWSVPNTPQERWDEWQRMELEGELQDRSEKQKRWRQTYQATPEFRMYQRKCA
ncbi:Mu transposase C-terminal domain-containing protein [Duganella sp. FT3S]|uniref:Mu transposase C-terminal domain-containing protein n=1 Tax=Rugamonas fusca TaxID=2758568 RepID=A0A7W2EHD0_9BURK|nr:Mu transposase C-terminal domain-containing protein [Rugamonas fusca]MBA5605864.1 Mu transposase C-terminal domain-containing protein [Rugamonas fusca]